VTGVFAQSKHDVQMVIVGQLGRSTAYAYERWLPCFDFRSSR
jgi:hypothetical protein